MFDPWIRAEGRRRRPSADGQGDEQLGAVAPDGRTGHVGDARWRARPSGGRRGSDRRMRAGLQPGLGEIYYTLTEISYQHRR
ncbi:MAG: hypothetical protein JWP18_1212 [Solirubrobacterales bacterium]|nr:hypothetical protein [Solirubrobacterales bacterium]